LVSLGTPIRIAPSSVCCHEKRRNRGASRRIRDRGATLAPCFAGSPPPSYAACDLQRLPTV
jgi:hypothetical protein